MARGLAVLILIIVALWTPDGTSGPAAAKTAWLRGARIAAPTDIWPGMNRQQIAAALAPLAAQGVNAVDIDASASPIEEQLDLIADILAYVRAAHPEMRIFVYQAPLEIVSPGVDRDRNGAVDPGRSSAFTQHPHWAQRALDGSPVLYYGADADAFWVGPTDEDLWLCPNDPEYRAVWRDELTRIAATGVDGVYIDVPFLRGWLDDRRGWGWACACEDCRALFRAQHGAEIPSAANWDDPRFRAFIEFRFAQIRNFLAECRRIVKQANPRAAFIVEHWDGLTDLVETACDPLDLPAVSDARAHEWTTGGGSVSRYHAYSWFEDQVRLATYRAIDDRQPTWILSYTDRGDTASMRALAASLLTAGCSYWETDAPDMAGSSDIATRTALFTWMRARSALLFGKDIRPAATLGLFYPRDSIVWGDYREWQGAGDAAGEFLGAGMILQQQHRPFRIVTRLERRQLEALDALILPNATCLSEADSAALREFLARGGRLLATGASGRDDGFGIERPGNALDGLGSGLVKNRATYGLDHYDAASPWAKQPTSPARAEQARIRFARLVSRAGMTSDLESTADRDVVFNLLRTNKGLQVRAFDTRADGRETTFSVWLRLPAGAVPSGVNLHTLLDDQVTAIEGTVENGVFVFSMPLRQFALAEIRMNW